MNYDPICGNNGRKYHNYCHLVCNGCQEDRRSKKCGGGRDNEEIDIIIPPFGGGGYIPKNPMIGGGFGFGG